MKGSNSRFSHRPGQRYSNTGHIQGGMVTDADLTESGQLHQARDEAQNLLAMPSGVPARDGVVRFENGLPGLQQGWVMAEGKQGRLVAASGSPAVSGAALFGAQADLPEGPPLPGGRALLYADLWERPVFAAQDGYLADPGLHGAETSYRIRTMTQIKALPLTGGMTLDQAMSDLQAGAGVFARTGNALASVTPKNTEIAVDDCDPCADQIEVVPTVHNALFRMEVVGVTRNAAGAATHARFAWSLENAAAIETMARIADPASGDAIIKAFERDGAVYEYFTEASEAQIGRFAPGITPKAPEFKDSLTETAASHVRRWDGVAEVNLTNSTITANSALGARKMTASAGKAKLTVDAFSMEVAFAGKELLVGDYWLIELRRFATEAERIRLVGGTGNKNAPPVGVRHHFCALFEVENGAGVAPGDATRRALSFPALTDIPATHVAFAPDCPPFFDNAQTVAEALNALCDLDASQVAFDPPADCARFEGTKTVEEALKKLCSVQDDTMLTRVLRVMMDWGVVCGIRPRLQAVGKTAIIWSAGTMLDRTGRLVEVKEGQFDLQDLDADHILGDLEQIMEKEGEICLSFAAGKDDGLEIFLSDHATAFGPADRTMKEAVEACIKGRKKIDFGDIMRPLKPEEAVVIKKLADVWANRKVLDGRVPLTRDEAKVTEAVNKTLMAEYVALAEPDRQEEVKKMIALAAKEYNPDAVSGAARDVRRMQMEAAKFGIIATAEEEDRIACGCANGLVPCPPAAGQNGHLVPVGCIKTINARSEVSPLESLCVYCCRKQAMTWRSARYYQGSFISERFQGLKYECCREREKPEIDFGKWLDEWVDDLYLPPKFEPRPIPQPVPDPIWPPKLHPDYGTLPTYPSPYDPRPFDPTRFINPKPDIAMFNTRDAEALLTGNGFDLVKTIELDDESDPLGALAKLGASGDTVLGRDAPEPGDKVAMVTRGGKAVDFVVVEKGLGKLPFETEAMTATRVEKVIADLGLTKAATTLPAGSGTAVDFGALEGKLSDLVKKRDETAADITKLADLRAALATEVTGLSDSLKEITTLRDSFATDLQKSRADLAEIEALKRVSRDAVIADIAKSRAELTELERLKTASLQDVGAARAELEEVRRANAEVVATIRREQPIEAVLGGNAEAVKALKAAGIVTVGDIESNNAAKLTSALRGVGGLNGSQAKALVNTFIRR